MYKMHEIGMARFFIEDHLERGDSYSVFGENAGHILRSLRMTTGERLILCNGKKTDYLCEITECGKDFVQVLVQEVLDNTAEPPTEVTLFQGMPKGDKLETIVQKAVELGATEIIPVLTMRCVSRPDGKAMAKKILRLQQIALEAAKQSGRGIVPKVGALLDFSAALEQLAKKEVSYLCYEREASRKLRGVEAKTMGIFIGPEGGFSPEEVRMAEERGISPLSLGKRILRTETAGLAALSILLYLQEL